MWHLLEDVGHGDRDRLEAVALLARALPAAHQDVDRPVAVRVLLAAPTRLSVAAVRAMPGCLAMTASLSVAVTVLGPVSVLAVGMRGRRAACSGRLGFGLAPLFAPLLLIRRVLQVER